MLQKATLVGKEETFKALGIEISHEINLEKLIVSLKKQLEQEFYDTENAGQEIIEGLKAVRDDKVDNRDWRKVLDEI